MVVLGGPPPQPRQRIGRGQIAITREGLAKAGLGLFGLAHDALAIADQIQQVAICRIACERLLQDRQGLFVCTDDQEGDTEMTQQQAVADRQGQHGLGRGERLRIAADLGAGERLFDQEPSARVRIGPGLVQRLVQYADGLGERPAGQGAFRPQPPGLDRLRPGPGDLRRQMRRQAQLAIPLRRPRLDHIGNRSQAPHLCQSRMRPYRSSLVPAIRLHAMVATVRIQSRTCPVPAELQLPTKIFVD